MHGGRGVARARWHPLRLLSASPQPAVAGSAVPPLSRHRRAEGAGRGGRGWFPGFLPPAPLTPPSQTKVSSSSQMDFPAVIQFSPGGGGPGSGRRISPASGLAQVKGAEVFV